jgi:hypothetical protein
MEIDVVAKNLPPYWVVVVSDLVMYQRLSK